MVKKKPNRRAKPRFKNKNKFNQNNVTIMGINAAGISSKLSSFKNVLRQLKPAIFFVEETKLKRQGKLKMKNYEVYELNRKDKNGGGIAIGIIEELKPVWISEGDDNIEVLTIEADINGLKTRCVGAYGPQEYEKLEKKKAFWNKLSIEVEDALNNEAAFILQMDGNLWGGPEIIKNDPNPCNENGKLFKKFLHKHPHLKVVNSLDLCEGVITRKRITKKRTEMSVLDFFVVCEQVLQFVNKMVVDEAKQYGLSNYFYSNGVSHKKDSDHNALILYLELRVPVLEHERKEMFNFKNLESQKTFLNLTNNTTALSKCFETDDNVEKQSKKWFKHLNSFFQQSFRKIRITKQQKPTKLSILFDRKCSLQQKLKKQVQNNDIIEELDNVEKEIAKEVANENREKVISTFKLLSNTDGTTNVNGMWGLKRKIFPKNSRQLPLAKKNENNKLISSQNELKMLYLKTFEHRLRHRPMKNNLKKLEKLKEELCSKRIKLAIKNKSEKWDICALRNTLKALKKNKTRDAHDLINEIFKPNVAGKDLENSMLKMFNKMKEEITIPEFMSFVNIVCIYKGKGSKLELKNDRGIFIINVLKSIFMKMVWKDIYDTLDENMSDSIIGGRKEKGIRNHIFIVNGIINQVINGKACPIDIEIIDYRQCFDSMWLSESLNDLYESGIQNDNLAIIAAANAKNHVAVKTPAGITNRVTIERLIMQGEVTGSGQCSNMIDTFGKECLKEDKLLYKYKDDLGVPPLAMVDDVLAISRCGVESIEMNAYLNQKTNIKRLQFGPEKCHQMHVGPKQITCPDLYINTWKLEKKDQFETGMENLVDVETEDHKIELTEDEKYLGDIITVNGKNGKNIEARVTKAQGIIKQLKCIFEEMSFGNFLFEVAVILRNSLFINGILTNFEASYGLTNNDVEKLEKCDEQLLRLILECQAKTPKEMLYLELGITPIRFIIISRRLMFYHYILNEDSESLLHKFYKVQARNPVKNDWSLTIQENLNHLKISLTENQIQNMSKIAFQRIVKESVQTAAFYYLVKVKDTHSKVAHISYDTLRMQDYLEPSIFSADLAKFTFQCRSRMLVVGENYKQGQNVTICPLCNVSSELDSQSHLLQCIKLNPSNIADNVTPIYEDLFSQDIKKKQAVAEFLKRNYTKRSRLLNQEQSGTMPV